MPNPVPCLPACNATPIVTNVPGPAGLDGGAGSVGPAGPVGPIPTFTTYAAYGSGTAYQMASSSAAPGIQVLALGTTQPSITLAVAGTYLIWARARIDMAGLTTGGTGTTVTTKLRCINNTVADLANTTRIFGIYNYLSTLGTGTLAELNTPVVAYVATAGDTVQLWGAVSATVSAGTISAVEADIFALKIA